MPSEKVSRILKKRGFSNEQIAAMSEPSAWDHVYATEPAKRAKAKGPDICFTGFTDSDRADLIAKAKTAGLNVVTKVTVDLFMLCTGDAPGAAKLKQAEVQGVMIVNRAQLETFCTTGEIPA